MDVLLPNWKNKILGVTTDGERKMIKLKVGLYNTFIKMLD